MNNEMFDGMIDGSVPLNVLHPEFMYPALDKWQDFIDTLPRDEKIELSVYIGPLDTVPRRFSYRAFTANELQFMSAHHRLIVNVTDIFDDKILLTEIASAVPQPDHDEEPDLYNGLLALIDELPTIASAAQDQVLTDLFKYVNFDGHAHMLTHGSWPITEHLVYFEMWMYAGIMRQQLDLLQQKINSDETPNPVDVIDLKLMTSVSEAVMEAMPLVYNQIVERVGKNGGK